MNGSEGLVTRLRSGTQSSPRAVANAALAHPPLAPPPPRTPPSTLRPHERADEEVVLGFSRERCRIPDAKSFRSTWLTSSQASLRQVGLEERYEKLLTGPHREAVLSAVPGLWLPMEVALEHYAACERLALGDAELCALGEWAVRRAQGTTLEFVVRMARGGGATPWTVLSQVDRFWQTTFTGGAVGVFKLGPKEARIEEVGLPLARFRYNRVTMRGILTGILGLFCRRVYVRELPRLCTERTLGFRVAWT